MHNAVNINGSMLKNTSFQDFLCCAKGKEVVCFGAGGWLHIAKRFLKEYDISISFAVDNNFWKNGTFINDIPIFSPEKLKNHTSKKNVCVLICSDAIFDIENQLQQLDIEHYFALPLFIEELYRKNYVINSGIPLGNQMFKEGTSVDIMINDSCNLSCHYCKHILNKTGAVMPLEHFNNILEQCRDLRIMGEKITRIRLDGNREALLHPNFTEILSETKKKGYSICIATNGTLLSREKAKAIAEFVDAVNISVTGVNPETYYHFQGSNRPGAAQQLSNVKKNVSGLVEIRNQMRSKLKIHISYILTGQSAHEVRNAVFFWLGIGVDNVRIGHNYNQYTIALENAKVGDIRYHKFPNGDAVCIRTSVVATSGDVYPCCLPGGEQIPIGNCLKSSLQEVFASPRYYQITSGLASSERELLPMPCRTCGTIATV